MREIVGCIPAALVFSSQKRKRVTLKFSYKFRQSTIYTKIILKSVYRISQTAGRNSCSIVSGNVSNCSYCLTVRTIIILYAKNIQNYSEYRVAHASCQLNRTSEAGNCGHGSSQSTSRIGNELSGDNILWSRLIAMQRAVGTATT